MAFKSFTNCILTWTTIIVGLTTAVELSDDIQAFLPTCAQPCLESFISSNFPSTGCTSNPSLECLCQERSNSGYTLGEGALQCISAEVQRGVCSEDVTGGSVKHDAYLMCSKIADSLPNTHSVLTATIVDSPTGGSASIILTTMSTMTGTGTVTSVPAPTAPSTISMAATTNPAAPSPAPASTPSLNGAQVAGITVGVAGAIIITFVAILVAKCIRKRKFPDLEDGLLTADDKRKSRASSSRNVGAMVISAPLHRFSTHRPEPRAPQLYRTPPPRFPLLPSNPSSSPNPFVSPNPNEESIGLAISQPQNTTPSASPEIPVRRPRSRLLPAKPTLSVKIPAIRRMSSSRTQRTDRTSVMTNMTAFADLDTEIVEGSQMWPPANGAPSGVPLYFDDKRKKWVLNKNDSQTRLAKTKEVAELDTYTPMTKSPHEKKEEEALAMAAAISAASALPMRPQPAFLSQDHSEGGLNRSSSVYSQASVVRRSSRLFDRARSGSRSRKGNATQLTRSDTVMSHDSITTINSCSSSPIDEDIPIELSDPRLSQLSTVIETPSPTSRRSPVRYPKIPGRVNRTIVQVDPPKRPNFVSSPPGQPSPTLKGAALPSEDAYSAYPQPLNTKRRQMPRGSNSTSPDIDADLPRPHVTGSQPSIQSPLSRFSPQAPNVESRNLKSSHPDRLRTPPMQTSGSGFSPNPPNLETFPTPSPMSSRSGARVTRAVSPLSLGTMNSGPAGTSSLLAKRIGNGKAAALTLTSSTKNKDRWKSRMAQGNMLSPDDASFPSAKGSLPHTPTWQPKLTPTRHGDDLYLDVQ
ncbi:hypothetical protein F4804DRAFT_317497 [Jackrogersella minutella]|nr:hypothetical protein F4804DRAFT_317497 [Jackrogersella minutella]